MQKVAGISGSEAHLLSLLPRLRERGWDVRMLMLHEEESGAWDFARELTARGVPLDAIRIRADVDPIAFAELPLSFERDDPASLAERLRWFASLSAEERAQIGRALRERVALRHSVETWADGVLAAVR